MAWNDLPPPASAPPREEASDRARARVERPREDAPRAWLTPAVIAILVLCFTGSVWRGVDLASPTARQLIDAGGNFGPKLLQGEWWRLVTGALLHGGPVHLLFNVWALYSAGRGVERIFGKAGFLAIYALSTLGASLLSVAVHPLVVSVGASGSIFGLFGALLAFPVVHRGALSREALKQQLGSMATFLVVNVAYALANPHVDLAAHAGGFFTGLAAGYLLLRDRRGRFSHVGLRVAGALALFAVLAAGAWGVRQRVARVPEVRVRTLADEALAAYRADDFEAAIRLYTQCLEVKRDDICLFDRGLANLALRRGEAALADLRATGAGINPARRQAALCEAAARFDSNDEKGREAAVQDCTRAIELAPSSLPSLRMRAFLYEKGGKVDAALADHGRVIELAPEDRGALERRARLLAANRRFGEAEQDCAALARLSGPERPLPGFCAAVARLSRDPRASPPERARPPPPPGASRPGR